MTLKMFFTWLWDGVFKSSVEIEKKMENDKIKIACCVHVNECEKNKSIDGAKAYGRSRFKCARH